MMLSLGLDEIPSDRDEALAIAGGKATNLAVMRALGMPVPPAFVITTEACRAFLAGGWPDGLDDELRARMADLESSVGRGFGNAADPLLVSVRSGAPVSMPGMMDTILDLGLNAATTDGLARATDDAPFAESCHERFATSFRSIVGTEAPDDPWQQLRLAVEAVFRSWESDRARTYRAKEGIADGLGTAVTVQAMVFGNRGADSGTGVLFTRDPATGEPSLYGDILFDAQGEDVVAGTHVTEPIAVLDARLPTVAAELRDVADRLERHFADLCDIEFTIEDGRLWLLQVRIGKRSPGAALRIAVDMASDDGFPVSRREAVQRVLPLLAEPPRTASVRDASAEAIATGLAASPGVASGPVVTEPAAAVASAEAGRPAILVRAETSPDDVHGMAVAAGILTSHGGLASHAAVVARGWGIPAVVGATEVEVHDDAVVVAGRRFAVGDVLTVDGSTGEVFAGAIAGASEVVPEVATLLAWAAEERIEVGTAAVAPPAARDTTDDEFLLAISIKGLASLTALAEAAGMSEERVQGQVDALLADGLVATTAGAYRLTDAGTERVTATRRAEQAAWGLDAAGAALDAFVDIDHRVKAIVTAWQVRDEATGVLNDHSDRDYDAAVLVRLAAIHAEATAWLGSDPKAPTRLAAYGERLSRALAAAQGGDGRYVASPRVDSYHGVWFELHEDLIQLAGRTRAAEVEAGRA